MTWKTPTRRVVAAWLACAAGLVGCIPQTTGDLDHGGFTYDCTGSFDSACSGELFNQSTLPAAIAVGAPFGLEYHGPEPTDEDGTTFPVSLEPAAPAVLSGAGHAFVFQSAGTVAILAKATNGTISDFVHLVGAPIASIAVTDDGGSPQASLALASGDSVILKASPRDLDGNDLAGALSYQWESSDGSVVALGSGVSNNRAVLTVVGKGTAEITITIDDAKAVVEVTAGEGGAP